MGKDIIWGRKAAARFRKIAYHASKHYRDGRSDVGTRFGQSKTTDRVDSRQAPHGDHYRDWSSSRAASVLRPQARASVWPRWRAADERGRSEQGGPIFA